MARILGHGRCRGHCGGDSSRVTILNAIINDKYLSKARDYAHRLTGIIEEAGVQVITKEIHPETIVGGVVGESLEYDLLVMGTSAVRSWEHFDFGPSRTRSSRTPSARC